MNMVDGDCWSSPTGQLHTAFPQSIKMIQFSSQQQGSQILTGTLETWIWHRQLPNGKKSLPDRCSKARSSFRWRTLRLSVRVHPQDHLPHRNQGWISPRLGGLAQAKPPERSKMYKHVGYCCWTGHWRLIEFESGGESEHGFGDASGAEKMRKTQHFLELGFLLVSATT